MGEDALNYDLQWLHCLIPLYFSPLQFVTYQLRCIHSEDKKWQSVAAATATAAATACANVQENPHPMNTFRVSCYSD